MDHHGCSEILFHVVVETRLFQEASPFQLAENVESNVLGVVNTLLTTSI